MQANLLSKTFVHKYNFEVIVDGIVFNVEIYLNEEEKFIDTSIKLNEIELGFGGNEGEIRKKIVEYIGENWDSLV